MESAIFGLVGVALGALLTVAKEWWFQSRKTKKDAEYLAIQVSCELERYVSRCAEVVGDDGLCDGQTDENGCHSIQVEAPTFDPKLFGVEWKSLPVNLMYEVLDFPFQGEIANRHVAAAFEYAASPPDFSEGFEERQFQYAVLGIAASQLVTKLRNYVDYLLDQSANGILFAIWKTKRLLSRREERREPTDINYPIERTHMHIAPSNSAQQGAQADFARGLAPR